MKTKIQQLEFLGIVGDIRKRLGAEDENDNSQDFRIEKMDNNEIIKAFCGWHLGSPECWIILKSKFDALERMDKE